MVPNLCDIDKKLFAAVRMNDVVSVVAAFAEGAGPNARCWNNRTPLHYAVVQAGAEMVKALLDAGADPDLDDDTGMTPLHEAVINRKFDVADILIDGGANINFQFEKKPAVIHSAFYEDLRNDETVRSEYMVRKGADLSTTTQRGVNERTVYEIAREQAITFPYAEVIIQAMMETAQKMQNEKDAAEQVKIAAIEAATAQEAERGITNIRRMAISDRKRYKF